MIESRLCILAAFAALTAWPSVNHAADSEVTDTLRSMSREFNKSLPLQIDHEKILEVTVVVQSTLIFKYKFTDEKTIDDPRFDKQKYASHLRMSLGESTCKDKNNFELLRKGAKYNYLFVNKRGLQIIDFTLDTKVCSEYMRM